MANNTAEDVYREIKNGRRRYGVLRKCEFHLHTPASHDYKIHGCAYSNLELDELLRWCIEDGLLTNEIATGIVKRASDGPFVVFGEDASPPFSSWKEALSYSLLAFHLFNQQVEAAVVCDHNRIDGYRRLRYAIQDLHASQRVRRKTYPHLFLGVEVSCSDKHHLIGIFDHSKFDLVEAYLREIIHGTRADEGTVYTSLAVMQAMSERLGGISYLAHVNSWDYKMGTGLYKKELFSSPYLMALGLSDLSQKAPRIHTIRRWTDRISDRFCFLHEGDAHDVIQVGVRNTWVKFGRRIDFRALRLAFHNHNISIYVERPAQSDKFIKGVCVVPGPHGFLSGPPASGDTSKASPLFVHFSRDLNCIIGGRGTGKSTLLNVIETVMRAPEVFDRKMLRFVSHHNLIYVVFHYKGNDYVIEFVPQTRVTDTIGAHDELYLPEAFIDRQTMGDHWIHLYNASKSGMPEVLGRMKSAILHDVYRRGYSINSLVTDIERGRLGDFIKRTVLNGIDYPESEMLLRGLRQSSRRSIRKYLRDNLSRMEIEIANRRAMVAEVLTNFNTANSDLLSIVYQPNVSDVDLYIQSIVESLGRHRGYFKGTRLQWSGAAAFFQEAVKKLGLLQFLERLFSERYVEIESEVSLLSYVSSPKSMEDVDADLQDVSQSNLRLVYRGISTALASEPHLLVQTIDLYFQLCDDFGLSFNINSREQVGQHICLMKPIETLSLGQKVTAILTFMFQFGSYVNDNTPLVIDQPEDNLDNQYIYHTLVKSLRDIKNSRQVIIATHSSTLLTNADAEQIVVMDSDNVHGWVVHDGAPTERHVTPHVLNYLEGGTESFRHKVKIFREHVEDL